MRIPKTIKIFGKHVPTWLAGVGVAGGIALAALFISENKVARIISQVTPQPLSPDRPSQLTGRFEDENGNPVKVKMGRFLVLNQQGQPVRGALIGPNTAEFNATIDMRGLPPGQYNVVVEDSLTG